MIENYSNYSSTDEEESSVASQSDLPQQSHQWLTGITVTVTFRTMEEQILTVTVGANASADSISHQAVVGTEVRT